jgi:hypothetical protein
MASQNQHAMQLNEIILFAFFVVTLNNLDLVDSHKHGREITTQ